MNLKEFEQLLFTYEKAIFRYLYRLMGSQADAEDLTQETFIKVYKNLKVVNQEKNVRAWIYKIATNTAYDQLRKKKGLVLSLDQEGDLIETIPDQTSYYLTESSDMINRALEQIKPIYKAVLMLFYQEDLSYQEISETLSLPINTVKTHIHRAKKDLWKILNKN